MTVGETPATVENAPQYAGLDGQGALNMVFQFDHVGIGDGPLGKWTTQRYDFMQLKENSQSLADWPGRQSLE